MTEAEWLACQDDWQMLKYLKDKSSDRKLRLFAVACCRSVWHLLSDDRSRRAVEVAERFADGHATERELTLAWEAAGNVSPAENGRASRHPKWHNVHSAAWYVAEIDSPAPAAWLVGERGFRIVVLRDLFGCVFHPRAVDPIWRNSTVLSIASDIHEDRAFEHLPILADALEDAGCSDRSILDHCRGPGPHVRGCWVVDLLLGKS